MKVVHVDRTAHLLSARLPQCPHVFTSGKSGCRTIVFCRKPAEHAGHHRGERKQWDVDRTVRSARSVLVPIHACVHCLEPGTIVFRWPGNRGDEHVCEQHVAGYRREWGLDEIRETA